MKKPELIANVLEEQSMNMFLRVDKAFMRGELPNPCPLADFIRWADNKGLRIKADVRAFALREGIIKPPEPLPWEMPAPKHDAAAHARNARAKHLEARNGKIVSEWKKRMHNKAASNRSQAAQAVGAKQTPKLSADTVIRVLKAAGAWDTHSTECG